MNILEFKVGDSITRVEPAKPYPSGVADRSYIGSSLVFKGIYGGLIYYQNDRYNTKQSSIPLDLWSEGWDYYKDLDAEPRKIQDGVVEGDILDCNGMEREVLGMCGKVVIVSRAKDFNTVYGTYTLRQMIGFGWKLKQEEAVKETPELTMEEAIKQMGFDFKIKK